jgi:hypothetical protein
MSAGEKVVGMAVLSGVSMHHGVRQELITTRRLTCAVWRRVAVSRIPTMCAPGQRLVQATIVSKIALEV